MQIEERLGQTLDELARQAFQDLAEDLDLVLVPAETVPRPPGMRDPTLALHPFLFELPEGGSLLHEGTL